MKLVELSAENYRSLHDETVELGAFNVFIGENASGKSTILDALRFLGEAVRERGFQGPTRSRGGLTNLAWKGARASGVRLAVGVSSGASRFEWRMELVRTGYDFELRECVNEVHQGSSQTPLLESHRGEGWWQSGEQGRISLKLGPTSCAFAAAAADISFPAREVAEFIARWGFFDLNPFLLRRDGQDVAVSRLDSFGRNLAETLYRLDAGTRERILDATRAIIGLPEHLEAKLAEDEGRCYFLLQEPGLRYPVHQTGASSGTLRVLGLMTALLSGTGAKVIGIEEPENYLHPGALSALVEYLVRASEEIQFLVTTHSPSVLDVLGDPKFMRVVRWDPKRGTSVEAADAERVRRAMDESGFGLGEYYETRGFGAR